MKAFHKSLLLLLLLCSPLIMTNINAQNDESNLAQGGSLKVAVFDPVGKVDESTLQIVREEISMVLVNNKGYTVLERQLINKVLEENKFQGEGLVDESQVSEIGKIMGADYVFISTITQLNENYYLSCKMIEVATARIEKQFTGMTKSGINDIPQTTQFVVKRLLGEDVKQQTVNTPEKRNNWSDVLSPKRHKKDQSDSNQPVVTESQDQQPLVEEARMSSQDKKVSFGVKAGFNFSDMSGDEVDHEIKLGPVFGVTMDYKLAENLFLLTALEFSSKGFKASDYDYSLTANALYLQIPLHAEYKFSLQDNVRFVIDAGPYFGFGFAGKGKYKEDGYTETFSFFGDSEVKPFDFGIGIGLGLEYDKLKFSIGYDWGLINISSDDDFNVHNRNLFIAVGYNF